MGGHVNSFRLFLLGLPRKRGLAPLPWGLWVENLGKRSPISPVGSVLELILGDRSDDRCTGSESKWGFDLKFTAEPSSFPAGSKWQSDARAACPALLGSPACSWCSLLVCGILGTSLLFPGDVAFIQDLNSSLPSMGSWLIVCPLCAGDDLGQVPPTPKLPSISLPDYQSLWFSRPCLFLTSRIFLSFLHAQMAPLLWFPHGRLPGHLCLPHPIIVWVPNLLSPPSSPSIETSLPFLC